MELSSEIFIFAFLPVVVTIHALINNQKARNVFLIAVSFAFWLWCGLFGFLIMLGLTFFNYLLAHLIIKTGNKARAAYLTIGIAANVSALLLDVILTGKSSLSPMLIRTMGIGFLTLRMISFIVGAYKGELNRSPKLIDFILYSSLFALMQRGPVVKYGELREQIESRGVSFERIARGITIFVQGLAMKAILSNSLYYASSKLLTLERIDLNVVTSWLCAILFLLRLYFDIAGYLVMVDGALSMLGFSIRENFNSPFASAGVSSFIERWHISLTGWFKEYLFMPILGKKNGFIRLAAASMTACIASAVWHSPNVSFILFGVVSAVFLFIDLSLKKSGIKLPKVPGVILTLLAVTIAFVPLQTKDVSRALAVYKAMFLGFTVSQSSLARLSLIMKPDLIAVSLTALILASPVPAVIKRALSGKKAFGIVRSVWTVVLFIVCIIFLSAVEQQPGYFEAL